MAQNFILTFTNTIFYLGDSFVIRVAGFFDEPGTFGFYIIFLLIINKLLNYSKRAEWLLIVSGMITTSLAFYIIIVVYLIFFYLNKKSFMYFLIFFVVFGSISLYINNAKDKSSLNTQIYLLTLGRFHPSEEPDQLIAGNNRYRQTAVAIKVFVENPVFGYGPTAAEEDTGKYNANFMGPFALHGFVGTTFLFLPVIYIMFFTLGPLLKSPLRIDTISLRCTLIILMQYLQRPHIIGFFTYFTIILLVHAFKNRRKMFLRLTNNSRYQSCYRISHS